MRYAPAMSRRSCLRTFAARASLTMLVALVVVWAASAWVWITVPLAEKGELMLVHGQLRLTLGAPEEIGPSPVLTILPFRAGKIRFNFDGYQTRWLRVTIVPVWVFAAPLALATALLWRSELAARRRARAGLCPTCHYDLAATPAGAPCPECGTPTSSAATALIDTPPPTA